MRQNGPDNTPNTYETDFVPVLERVKEVEVCRWEADTVGQYYIDAESDGKKYGLLLTKEVYGNSNYRYWLVMLPELLAPSKPANPSDLRDDVFPTYEPGSQLFIGRLDTPVPFAEAIGGNSQIGQDASQLKQFRNTHELVVNDYNQRNARNVFAGATAVQASAAYDHLINNNPLFVAYYADMNIAGRNRTPASVAEVGSTGAPNVWL